MTKLEIGDLAPDFSLPTDQDRDFTLSAELSGPVVLMFYPEDDTDGCTIENIEFTQLMGEFRAANTQVLGISPDSVEKHCKFRDKYDLDVLLVADPEHVAISAYDVWGDKNTFGHDYQGLIRTSFLVAPDGTIANIWVVTRVKGHAAEVLEAAKALAA